MITPSTPAVAENLQRTVEGIAKEIGRRVAAVTSETTGAVVEIEARRVLLDWFLGDFHPTEVAPSLRSPDGAIESMPAPTLPPGNPEDASEPPTSGAGGDTTR